MSEYRTDPFTGRWVLLADERSRRPLPVSPPTRLPPGSPHDCPFCPGNEDQTGGPIVERGDVRVVANRFPALRVEASGEPFGTPLHRGHTGLGAHEVVIETSRHDRPFADLDDDALYDVLSIWRDRVADLFRDERLNHVLVYKNHEAAAGASLPHPHSQVTASPFVAPIAAEELRRSTDHHESEGRCLRCDVLAEVTRTRERVVLERGPILAVAPFAARVPFETTLATAGHQARFEHADEGTLRAMASTLGTTLRRIRVALADPAYTLTLHTAPRGAAVEATHWHLNVVPRLVPLAGFEWGTGTYINPTRPEEAAKALRALSDVI
jgi:UDPglucose--hexose-1-phosphate uridylyltransferase